MDYTKDIFSDFLTESSDLFPEDASIGSTGTNLNVEFDISESSNTLQEGTATATPNEVDSNVSSVLNESKSYHNAARTIINRHCSKFKAMSQFIPKQRVRGLSKRCERCSKIIRNLYKALNSEQVGQSPLDTLRTFVTERPHNSCRSCKAIFGDGVNCGWYQLFTSHMFYYSTILHLAASKNKLF